MSARFPDSRTIHAVLLLATRAPSIHNSQPWRWKVGAESLRLYADPGRHLPNTDPDSRDLLLSCGASLHHAVVALAAMGWQATVHRLPDPLHPEHLATIEVSRHPASELDVSLAAAIPRRRTDRRHYAWWPVPDADIALIAARTAGAQVMMRRVTSLPKLPGSRGLRPARQPRDRCAGRHCRADSRLRHARRGSGRTHAVGAAVNPRAAMMSQRQELEVLDRQQCLALLGTVQVGRLVFTEDALPAVQPVNFRLCGDDVVIRVAGGAKLAAAERNFVVAFQADELDPDLRAGWSVTVVGHAQRITDVDKLVEVSGTFLQPWVDGRRDHFIRIRTERVTGRRLREPVESSRHEFPSAAQRQAS